MTITRNANLSVGLGVLFKYNSVLSKAGRKKKKQREGKRESLYEGKPPHALPPYLARCIHFTWLFLIWTLYNKLVIVARGRKGRESSNYHMGHMVMTFNLIPNSTPTRSLGGLWGFCFGLLFQLKLLGYLLGLWMPSSKWPECHSTMRCLQHMARIQLVLLPCLLWKVFCQGCQSLRINLSPEAEGICIWSSSVVLNTEILPFPEWQEWRGISFTLTRPVSLDP